MRSLVSHSAAVLALLGFAAFASAQTGGRPGQLANASGISQPSFSADMAGASSSPVLPKVEIARIEDKSDTKGRRLWIASICMMVGASAADAATSWGKYEGNSFLASSDGRFGAKGLSIKAAIAGGGIVPQLLLRRHRNLWKPFTVANFVEAGVFTGTSIHNIGVPAARP
ncbi:MAG: hypothetical protein JOY62_05860 [Acidobacteriaceae bacterium]|nr:hypothetical protein [Acidobacteriaceae bacterium]MBV9779484.1 hypothetical protein [Acidobacteriaceae bacterium]